MNCTKKKYKYKHQTKNLNSVKTITVVFPCSRRTEFLSAV